MKTMVWIALLTAVWSGASASGQQMVVVANHSVKAQEISVAELRDIFLGGTTHFKVGGTAIPVLLRSGPENDAFLSAYIGKVDQSFRNSWRSLVFTGQASMPKNEEDDEAMLNYVASTPGAIGYIKKTSLRDTVTLVKVTTP